MEYLKILLSIKPCFVDKILTGEKKYEFRKKLFKQDVDTVIIYSCMPIGKIIGEFTVEEILEEKPVNLWSITKEYAGISKNFFLDYFKNRSTGCAIKINKFQQYNTPVDPKRTMDNFVAPQSYRYIDEITYSQILGIAN